MGYTETVGLNIVATGTFSNLLSEVNKFKSELKALKLPDNVTKKLEGSFDKLNVEAEKFKNILSKGVTTKGDFSKLMSSAKSVEAAMRTIKTEVASINDKQIRLSIQNLPEIKQLEGELNKLLGLQKQFKNFGTSKGVGAASAKEVVQIEQLITKMQEAQGIRTAFNNVGKQFATGNIDKMTQAITRLVAEVDQYRLKMANVQGATTNTGAIISWANSLQQSLNKTVADADKVKASINQLQTNKFNQMKGSIDGISSGLNTATNNMRNFVSAQTQAAGKTSQLSEQVGLLRTQANYFFGLQNIGRLISRGIRQAADSVRDLDKAMTETAVVTDFTVTQMWDKLPKYTALANKLGATTQGAYETMTLYFQQGLNEEQTFQIGEETMKMARIAGLDYAQTTNMMTAALRGFNMELNNTSAQRVNDVYSKLAAITASDTRELGLAMERTASIANSAGMDFGNTTAFLAQMIETTREAPENLGTAMKTIVARFQELKQNPYEIGEVEGEEVDFNRVDKALKTIGVDLMDNKDKFRDLDEVFLEISEKWDGLSQTQQRYIATIAAGARQQSRFIAMVQNYDRLKELTEAAANSEGAAEVQFSKTLDSYEAKINKLKNAWQTFTMGLADNKVIKGGVGILEKIITLADKIIDLFGKAGNAIGGDFGKSIAQMAAAFGMAAIGFRGLRGGAKMGLGMLDRMTAKNAAGETGILPAGKIAAKGMADVTKEERAAVMQKRKALYQMMNKGVDTGDKLKPFNIQDLQKNLKDLSAEQQKALYSSSPGLRKAMQKSWGEAYKNMSLTKETNAAVKNQIKTIDGQIKNGETTVQKALARTMNPYQVGKDIGGATGREIMTAIDKEIAKRSAKDSAHHGAFKKMKQDYGHQASKLVAQGKLSPSEAKGWVQERLRADTGRMMQEENISKTPVAINKATAAMSAFSGATMKGGQAMMGLGMAMSAAGFPAFGGIVMTAGTALMGVGMAAEGAAAGISKVGIAIKSLYASNPVLLAIAAVATAVAGTVAAIKIINNKAVKETRKAGDKVVETYAEATKKTQKELDKLANYQEKWATWTAGVDENGNNINLEPSEYKDYLKAVKEITTAHPELIKGYNALGNAIVDNNTVLREANKLAKETEKQAKEDYLNSGQKIVDSMKTKKRWKATQADTTFGVNSTNIAWGMGADVYKNDNRSKLQKEAQAVMDSIKEAAGGEELLRQYGITWDNMGNITQEGIENLRNRAGDLNNSLANILTGEENEKIATDINDKIATLGETIKGLEDVSKDYYDWGLEYAASKGYDKLDNGLIAPFQTAIQRIAEQGLDQSQTEVAIDAVGRKYQNLGGYLQDFQNIQEQVNEAQADFGKSFDSADYSDKIQEIVAPMDDWIDTLGKSADQTDRILSDWLKNQKEKFVDFTESLPTLEQAFNSLSGEITAANSAYDNWSKQNEGGDLYTGVENYKKMFDEINDDIDNIGHGSSQWWSAAQSMFGDDYVFEHTEKQVKNHMKEVGKYLEEGAKGIDNFMTDLRDNKLDNTLDKDIFGVKKGDKPYKISDFIDATEDGGLNFDKIADLTDEQFAGLAKGIGLSTEMFTALLNKARQFTNIKFGNVETMREALYGSDFSIVGQESTNGNRNLYVRESEFRQQGIQAGIRPNEIKDYQKQMEKAGTIFLKNANKIDKADLSKYIQDWGINTGKVGEKFQTTTDAFIRQFDKLGYNKDEIQELYKTALKDNLLEDGKDVNFSEAYEVAKEKNMDPSIAAVTSIDGTTSSILGVTQAIAAGMGILTKSTQNDIKDATKTAREHAADLRLGTGEDYASTKKALEGDIANLEDLKASLEAGQANYEEGSQKWNDFQAQIDSINNTLDIAKKSLEQVTEASYAEAQAKKEVKDFTQQEGGQKALLAYNENGWGNTNFASRSQNAINWGEDPTKNSNWKNLNTWGKQNKDNWANTESTYWSQANHFGSTEKNKGVEIAFTPIQQKKDGSLEVLAKDEVNAYMDAITKAASDNQGNVDVNKLMGLDAGDPAYQEELKQLGIESKGLIMGAFTGEGAEAASGQFGALEHIFSEGLLAEDTSFSGLKQAATDAAALGQNLEATGTQGAIAAESLKTSFLEVNSEALSKLDTNQLYEVTSAAGIATEEVANFAALHPELNLKVNTEDEEFQETKGEIETEENTEHNVDVTVNTKEGEGEGTKGAISKVSEEAKNTATQTATVPLTLKPEITNPEEVSAKGIKEKANIPDTLPNQNITATYTLKASVSSGSAKKDLKSQAKAAGKGIKGGKITTTATLNTGNFDKGSSKVNKEIKALDGKVAKPSIKVNNNASGTISSVSSALKKLDGKTATTTIKTVKKTVKEGSDDATGQNQVWTTRSVPQVGSARKGSGYGRIGPKGVGGITLTGEEGFEIAWLPDESRSMILGARGPQMVDLPKNAVVWTHEQSKKIMRQKSIPAGSHAKTASGSWKPSDTKTTKSSSKTTTKRTKTEGKGGSKKENKDNKNNAKETKKILQKAGKINAWWWNMTKKVESTQRRIDKLSKQISDLLKQAGTTLKDITKKVNTYILRLNQQIKLNTQMRNKASKQLSTLDKGKTSKATKKAQKQVTKDEKRLAKAKKTKGKKDDKAAKKQLEKDRKKLRKTQKGVNWANISYEVTERKKNKKGKVTKSKKTKKTRINLAPFITYDTATGAYIVDYKRINKKYGKNQSKAKAVMEAAEKKIDDYQGKKNTAQDNIDKANEALKQLGQDLYDNFYGWKNELTKILELTQKIADAEKQTSRFKAMLDLDSAMSANLDGLENTLEYFKGQLNSMVSGINTHVEAISKQKEIIDKDKSSKDELAKYDATTKKLEDNKKAEKNKEKAKKEYNTAKKKQNNDKKLAKTRDKLVGKSSSKKTKKKEQNKIDKANSKIKSLEAKKKKTNSKKELKKLNNEIKTQKKIKSTASKNIKAIKQGDAAKKRLTNDATKVKTTKAAYNDAKKQVLSPTKVNALQTLQQEQKEAYQIANTAQKYVKASYNGDGTLSLSIDENAIEKDQAKGLLGKEMAEGIKEYYDTLVEDNNKLSEEFEGLTGALTDFYDTLKDLQEQYADDSEKLLEAVEDAEQEKIKQFEKLSSAISDSLKDLLDEVKKRLEERRKQEDNKKTRDDISKKQQRLAALRANTAGGNQVEIAQLEKEIADAQQNYQRSLEDQLLDRLQDQADEAEKQRERQIALLSAQLDVDKATNKNVELINEYLSNPDKYKDQIDELFKKANDYEHQTAARQAVLDGELKQLHKDLDLDNGLPAQIKLTKEAIGKIGTAMETLESSIGGLAASINKNSDLGGGSSFVPTIDSAKEEHEKGTSAGELLSRGYTPGMLIGEDVNNPTYSYTEQREAGVTAGQIKEVSSDAAEAAYQQRLQDAVSNGKSGLDEIKNVQKWGAAAGHGFGTIIGDLAKADGAGGVTWKALIKTLKEAKAADGTRAYNTSRIALTWGQGKGKNDTFIKVFNELFKDDERYTKNKKKSETPLQYFIRKGKADNKEPHAFATGGLASYTGPAWLDGTPSKPELVLNPTDTKNFLALRDVLGKAIKTSNTTNNAYGNNTYEININVDHINNDYDVDRIAERVKKDIVKSASYRNVTQVRNFR